MPGTKIARIAMLVVAAVVILGMILAMVASPAVY
jgi:hypothetical protein